MYYKKEVRLVWREPGGLGTHLQESPQCTLWSYISNTIFESQTLIFWQIKTRQACISVIFIIFTQKKIGLWASILWPYRDAMTIPLEYSGISNQIFVSTLLWEYPWCFMSSSHKISVWTMTDIYIKPVGEWNNRLPEILWPASVLPIH